MNRPLKAGMIAGIVGILAVGLIELVLAKSENDFFQFCTTKAYGWPTPWTIDYCECEGAKIVCPTRSKIVNLSTIAAGGIGGFTLFWGIARLQRRPAEQGGRGDGDQRSN